MTRNCKENIQYASAIGMLLGGFGLTVAAFVVPPVGKVDDSILWILGQCLIYAGSVFGVANYVNMQIDKRLKGKE